MTVRNIELKVKELKELQRMSEELNAEMENIKDELKREMELRCTDEIVTNEYKLRYKAVESKRFDTTSFKSKYADLYEQFAKATVTKRFSIA